MSWLACAECVSVCADMRRKVSIRRVPIAANGMLQDACPSAASACLFGIAARNVSSRIGSSIASSAGCCVILGSCHHCFFAGRCRDRDWLLGRGESVGVLVPLLREPPASCIRRVIEGEQALCSQHAFSAPVNAIGVSRHWWGVALDKLVRHEKIRKELAT